MTDKTKRQACTPHEAKIRFEAVLHGARLAGPQHVESVTPKGKRTQQ